MLEAMHAGSRPGLLMTDMVPMILHSIRALACAATDACLLARCDLL